MILHGGELGDQVGGIMGAEAAGAQVEGAVEAVEEERVAVVVLEPRSESGEGGGGFEEGAAAADGAAHEGPFVLGDVVGAGEGAKRVQAVAEDAEGEIGRPGR